MEREGPRKLKPVGGLLAACPRHFGEGGTTTVRAFMLTKFHRLLRLQISY